MIFLKWRTVAVLCAVYGLVSAIESLSHCYPQYYPRVSLAIIRKKVNRRSWPKWFEKKWGKTHTRMKVIWTLIIALAPLMLRTTSYDYVMKVNISILTRTTRLVSYITKGSKCLINITNVRYQPIYFPKRNS